MKVGRFRPLLQATLLILSLAKSNVATGVESEPTECDRLASSPHDKERLAEPVELSDLDHGAAIKACKSALDKSSESGRLEYLLGRAYYARGARSSAFQHLFQASKKGHVAAMAELGAFFSDINLGDYGPKKSAIWHRMAAEKGSLFSKRSLGHMHLLGVGVEKNPKKAADYFREAAELGDSESQLMLGTMLSTGLVEEIEESESVRWLERAAAQGSVGAMLGLGNRYFSRESPDHDPGKAIIWYRKAASLGIGVADMMLGFIYENGVGVHKNPSRALEHYRSAYEKGEEGARVRIQRLE